MKITIRPPTTLSKADALVLAFFEKQKPQEHPYWIKLPTDVRKLVSTWVGRKDVTMEWPSTHVLRLVRGRFTTIVVAGLGKRAEWNDRRDRLLDRKIVRLAHEHKWRSLTIMPLRLIPENAGRMAENFILADYDYHALKKAPPAGWHDVRSVTIIGIANPDIRSAMHRGIVVGEATNMARAMAKAPGSHLNPRIMEAEEQKIAKAEKLTCRVLNEAAMQKLGMGALLGVAKGSTEPPRFIVLEYRRGPAKHKPLVLVGKGVTFDSGGLNLKPSTGMQEMHMDMAGGAAVLGALRGISRLKLPLNVIGLIPAVENMPSGSGFRPGDVLKSMSGTTIEVGNTDAEGRVILADALTYAQKHYEPVLVVDVATLTGAAVVALGQQAMAMFSPDGKLLTQAQEIAEASGDYGWPLPLWDEYAPMVKGTFGDVTNSGKERWGGAIEGAMFLYQFIKKTPWIHLDIAPTMSSIEGQHLAPGATGAGTRWLIELARRWTDGRLKLT